MKSTTIFITYNPNVASEHTLAVRLHSIGAVNGFRMYLPDRYNSDSILDAETQRRINLADYMVFFSLGKLSNIVKQEIEYAFKHFQDKSKIIVIYNSVNGKNLKGEITHHFTSFQFNPVQDNQERLLQNIVNTIFQKQKTDNQNTQIRKIKEEQETQQGISALLGIGLGLFVLDALIDDK
jgi:hypothetical protein